MAHLHSTASLALTFLRLALLKPQETWRVVVENIALLRFSQEVGRLGGFDSGANDLRPMAASEPNMMHEEEEQPYRGAYLLAEFGRR
jgi:hypothetical protein